MIADVLDNVNLAILMPIEGTFILDTSFLDGDDLLSDDPGPNYEWAEVLCESSEINITRGLNLNQNVLATAESSELVATVHGPRVDPLTSERLIPNTSIRVQVWANEEWQTLFLGKIAQTQAIYSKDREASVTFVAYDFVRELSNVQSSASTTDTFQERIEAMASAGGATVAIDGGTTTLGPLVNSRSVWDIMNIAAASEGGLVFPTRTGELRARGRQASQGDNFIDFSDEHQESSQGNFHKAFSSEFALGSPHSCYTDIDISYDTTNVINSLTVSNIATYDSNGDIEEKMPVYTDSDSATSYGQVNVSLYTNLPDDAAVEDLRDYIFDNYSRPRRRVESLTYSPEEYWQTLVDLGNYVELVFHDANDRTLFNDSFLVTKVQHLITPEQWSIQLGLYLP